MGGGSELEGPAAGGGPEGGGPVGGGFVELSPDLSAMVSIKYFLNQYSLNIQCFVIVIL